jgi:hypothetical protein
VGYEHDFSAGLTTKVTLRRCKQATPDDGD